jgi:signal peptidase I
LKYNSEINDDVVIEKKEINYIREIVEMILYFLVVLAVVFFVYTFIGEQVEVSGSSMESTLQDKDHLILEKVSYRFHEPERFDIVVFRPYEDNDKLYYIKRIIGLPGETVQIIGSDIYIDDEKLVEDYGKEPIIDGGTATEPITLGEGQYFVLGDNRNNSKDSRFEEVGLVQRDSIIGRTWIRIWPFNKMGILKHR